MKRLTRLKRLELHKNPALEKPPGCPKGNDIEGVQIDDMAYYGKKEVAAFLACLP